MFDSTTTPAAPSTAERLADATAAHDQAQQRRQAAHASAQAARQAASEAEARIAQMIGRAASAGGDIDVADHERATMEAAELARAADALAAVARGSDRLAEEAAIALHHARAADLLQKVREAAAAEIAAAQAVDETLALLRQKIAAFECRAREGAEAVSTAKAFDASMPAALKHNQTAGTMHASDLPRVRISDRIGQVTVRAGLTWTDTYGVTHEVMNDLAPWRRVGWEGLAPAGPMPVGPIMRAIPARVI